MKRAIYFLFIILTAVNLSFAAYPLFKGEVHFFNDVARDFLLLRELDEKKIMLIGPRSNASGLFHGPLWSYINYPVYKIVKGNPVSVAWFWMGLGISAMLFGYWGIRKIFGNLPALVFSYLYSYILISHINGMFHSDSPVFFTPILILSAIFYAKYKKWYLLIIHLITALVIMQLNVGVGIPILILSLIFSIFTIIRHKLWVQALMFLLIPIFLSNFIIFDLRHDSLLSKSAIEFYNYQKYHSLPSDFFLKNRLESTVHLQFYYSENFYLALFLFTITLISSVSEIIRKKLRLPYFLILYFYLGYMILSFTNKGVVLSHYIYLLVPITSMWFSSFFRRKYLRLFFPIILVLIFLNLRHLASYISNMEINYMGRDFTSWRSMKEAADTIIRKQNGREFGYFVFAPDAFAYGPRYAMIYNFANHNAFEYNKKPTTWIIAEPPPKNDKYMTHEWWRKNPVKITSDPIFVKTFKSGFTVEEYILTHEELKIPHDKTIELGIHFR